MILYNVTVNIESAVEKNWLEWMKSKHAAAVIETGCFDNYKIMKLLNDDPEAVGGTYAVQYYTSDVARLNKYLDQYAEKLQKEALVKYPNKFVAFRTFLEEV